MGGRNISLRMDEQKIDRIDRAVVHLAEHPGTGRPGRVQGTRELRCRYHGGRFKLSDGANYQKTINCYQFDS